MRWRSPRLSSCFRRLILYLPWSSRMAPNLCIPSSSIWDHAHAFLPFRGRVKSYDSPQYPGGVMPILHPYFRWELSHRLSPISSRRSSHYLPSRYIEEPNPRLPSLIMRGASPCLVSRNRRGQARGLIPATQGAQASPQPALHETGKPSPSFYLQEVKSTIPLLLQKGNKTSLLSMSRRRSSPRLSSNYQKK